MANESIIAVPANVEDPTVLRRFLVRLIEQLDIVLGNRIGKDTAYVEQRQLLNAAAQLQSSLEEAKINLERAAAILDAALLNFEAITEERFKALEDKNVEQDADIAALQNYAAIKGAMLKFTVDSSNNIVHLLSYNIDEATSVRLGVGSYEFTLDQDTFFSFSVTANSTLSSGHVIANSATSDVYDVEVESSVNGKYLINVRAAVVGAGSKLAYVPYDLVPGDVVTATAIFNLPNSTLPPV